MDLIGNYGSDSEEGGAQGTDASSEQRLVRKPQINAAPEVQTVLAVRCGAPWEAGRRPWLTRVHAPRTGRARAVVHGPGGRHHVAEPQGGGHVRPRAGACSARRVGWLCAPRPRLAAHVTACARGRQGPEHPTRRRPVGQAAAGKQTLAGHVEVRGAPCARPLWPRRRARLRLTGCVRAGRRRASRSRCTWTTNPSTASSAADRRQLLAKAPTGALLRSRGRRRSRHASARRAGKRAGT